MSVNFLWSSAKPTAVVPASGQRLRRQFRAIAMNPHRILDQFEAAWAKGRTPEVAEYVAQLPRKDCSSSVCELVKIDLERRWRAAQDRIPRYPLEYYLSLKTIFFNDAELVDLIGWEYAVRNRWGDCPTRTEMAHRFLRLLPALEVLLKQVADEIQWPRLALTANHQVLAEIALNGPVEVGRQREHDPAPFSVAEQPEFRRLIVADQNNSSISRSQLQIRLRTPRSVQLTNSSRKRAVAIYASDALDAGKTGVCELPVKIHLFEERFLYISTNPLMG